MKVSKLKELIENVGDDVEIVVYADHGQSYEKSTEAGTGWLLEDDYENQIVSSEDEEFSELMEMEKLTEAIVIFGQ